MAEEVILRNHGLVNPERIEQWPKWGQFIETAGEAGEKIDQPEAQQLFDLLEAWRNELDTAKRGELWTQILGIWSDQVYSIGTVNNVKQPVVVSRHLHNVPETAVWAWEPGAFFGVHKPDTFWMDDDRPLSALASGD